MNVVYFVAAGDAIKIGHTAKLPHRISALGVHASIAAGHIQAGQTADGAQTMIRPEALEAFLANRPKRGRPAKPLV